MHHADGSDEGICVRGSHKSGLIRISVTVDAPLPVGRSNDEEEFGVAALPRVRSILSS